MGSRHQTLRTSGVPNRPNGTHEQDDQHDQVRHDVAELGAEGGELIRDVPLRHHLGDADREAADHGPAGRVEAAEDDGGERAQCNQGEAEAEAGRRARPAGEHHAGDDGNGPGDGPRECEDAPHADSLRERSLLVDGRRAHPDAELRVLEQEEEPAHHERAEDDGRDVDLEDVDVPDGHGVRCPTVSRCHREGCARWWS